MLSMEWERTWTIQKCVARCNRCERPVKYVEFRPKEKKEDPLGYISILVLECANCRERFEVSVGG